MAKPNTLPRWATVGGDVVTPSSGKQDVGWLEAEEPPAQYQNWLQYWIYQWLLWLSNSTIGFFPGPILVATNWSIALTGLTIDLGLRSTGAGQCYLDLGDHLMNGDYLTSIGFTMEGDGAADLTVEAIYVPKDGSAPTSLGSTTINNEPAALANKTLNVTDTVITNDLGYYVLVFTASATGLKVYHISATVTLPP